VCIYDLSDEARVVALCGVAGFSGTPVTVDRPDP
jgi:hypothetical protein